MFGLCNDVVVAGGCLWVVLEGRVDLRFICEGGGIARTVILAQADDSLMEMWSSCRSSNVVKNDVSSRVLLGLYLDGRCHFVVFKTLFVLSFYSTYFLRHSKCFTYMFGMGRAFSSEIRVVTKFV